MELAFQFAVATLLFVGLTGCGGGGGGSASGPVVSTLSFPLLSGYKSLIANGASNTFTVSGNCSGTGNLADSPATTPATFEGVGGFSAASTLTMTLTNCIPASTAATATQYYDSNYIPLGYNYVGVHYGVYLTPPTIPTSVTVGSAGTVGTETLYTDSTKATFDGTDVLSYVVEADTANTAIVNLITRDYDSFGVLTSTDQNRYRITATGGLTHVSEDIQYANGSTMHLIITYH